MSKSNWELWAVIIGIVEFDINYYIYSETKSLANILMIIVISMILGLAFIISNIYEKIKDNEEKLETLNQKLIRYKELEDIRVDIREIKKELKNG